MGSVLLIEDDDRFRLAPAMASVGEGYETRAVATADKELATCRREAAGTGRTRRPGTVRGLGHTMQR